MKCGSPPSGGGQRRRRKHSVASRDRAGDRVLLGWKAVGDKCTLGFSASAQISDEQTTDHPIWLEGEGHLITIAPTGAGKGRGALIPNLLVYEGPAIVIDPKGEAFRVTARRRREMGQRVHVIDPFGVVTDQGDSLNPMDMFDCPGVDASALAMDIAKQLSGGGASLNDPFWDIRGHDLAAGLIAAVGLTDEREQRTLKKVRSTLKSDDANYNIAVLLDTIGDKIGRFAREELSSYLQTEDKCRSGIHATACSYFSIVAFDAAQKTIGNTTIDLDAVAAGEAMTIYLVVPPHKLASHAALFRLWTSLLLSTILGRNAPVAKHRTLFAIDEWAQLGKFSILPMVYTLGRSYGVRVWAFFQDLSQLRGMLKEDWQTVITNTAALQVFGVPNHLTARDLASVLGDFSDLSLRQMDRAQIALQCSGQRGLIARRLDYLNDAMFAGAFDRSHQAPPERDRDR